MTLIRGYLYRAVWLVVMGLPLSASMRGQFIGNGMQRQQPGKAQAVEYLFPEQMNVQAGKVTKVLLHFRVASGLHINSHTPHDEFLIPTVFSILEGKGVRLESTAYPKGSDVTLSADPKTKLNVYTGEFTIEAQILAEQGNHLLEAKLRFQACDQSQCMPPKTIPVAIDVIGK
jgi:hypothetical protein